MRILQVVGGAGIGGVERVVAVLSQALGERGHSVRLVVLGVDGPLSSAARSAGIDVTVLGLPLRGVPDAAGLRRVPAALARLSSAVGWADVVQTHLFRTALLVTPLARARRVPVVGALHGLDPSAVQRRRMRTLLKAQSCAVCVSEALRRTLVSQEGFPAQRLRVVPNGVATTGPLASGAAREPSPAERREARDELLRAHGLPPDALLVGCIGRLFPRKGQSRLLRAFATVGPQVPAAHLLLAGDGPDRAALEEQSRAPELAGRVHLLGEVPDPAPVLRGLDLLAVPSDYEGFGLVVVEAMLTGVPVVASAAGGPEDLVEDGVSGRLAPVGADGVDVQALAAALTEALTQPQRRAAWAQEAGRRAGAYLAPSMAEGYERVYLDVLAARGR